MAGGAAYVRDTKVPLRIDFADDVAGPFPANFLCFQVGGGPHNLCDKGTGAIYGYNPACSVPDGAGKSTTFTCTADYGQVADGNVWACVIAADASIPDNPSGPNQTASADKANLSAPSCDGVIVDRTPPSVSIGGAAGVGQGGRARVVLDVRGGRDLRAGRCRAVDVGRQHRGRDRRCRHAHLHPARHVRGRADRDRRRGQRGDGEEDDHGCGRRRRDGRRRHGGTGGGTAARAAARAARVAAPAGRARAAGGGTGGGTGGAGGGTGGTGGGRRRVAARRRRPAARDGGDAPSLELDVPRSARARAKSIPVELTADDAGRVQLALVRGGRTIVRASVTLDADGTADYRLKLPKGIKAGALHAQGDLRRASPSRAA